MRFLYGLFLIAHAGIHPAIWVLDKPADPDKPPPFDPSHSWLLGDDKPKSVALAWIAAVLFAIAGLLLLLNVGAWAVASILAALVSLVLLVLFFHPWLLLGIAIDVAIAVVAVSH